MRNKYKITGSVIDGAIDFHDAIRDYGNNYSPISRRNSATKRELLVQ